MTYLLGILFSFVALFSWGFGDFFIQRTTRLVGSWRALLYIAATGSIVLFPFIYGELPLLDFHNILLLLMVGIIILGGALFDFEALRQGKIAIIEPIISLELPITVGLSMILLRENLTLPQLLLIVLVSTGIIFAMTAHKPNFSHRVVLEKGVILALIGAIGMALNNLIIGFSSQTVSPLMTIWFGHSMVTLLTLIYLGYNKQLHTILPPIKKYTGPILAQSILDNLAWISYAIATSMIGISITTTISESYIALTVLLGIYINHEKLRTHQKIGAVLAIISVIILSAISG